MNRSQIAKRLGINISAVRFYEETGLLKGICRNKNGYRIYEESDIVKLQFIIRAKHSGLKLRQIKGLFEMLGTKKRDKERAVALINQQINEVDQKILELEQVKASLHTIKKNVLIDDCPYIDKIFP